MTTNIQHSKLFIGKSLVSCNKCGYRWESNLAKPRCPKCYSRRTTYRYSNKQSSQIHLRQNKERPAVKDLLLGNDKIAEIYFSYDYEESLTIRIEPVRLGKQYKIASTEVYGYWSTIVKLIKTH
jgi:predicted  nucleic acid-binding Zn-ribbon protein